jgi:tyrosinase
MGNGTTLTRYSITDLNNNQIPEFPTENGQIPGWDPISLYYAKALQEMGFNDPPTNDFPDAPGTNDPRDPNVPYPNTPNPGNTWTYSESPESYFFWGAMHWWPGNDWELWNGRPGDPQLTYWSHCTHDPNDLEKYFLPWHRIYIYFFEVIIRAKVQSLGGPEGWAIPFWDYSGDYQASAASGKWPNARLPWAFCQTELPDGSKNPLYLDVTRRGLQPVWPQGWPNAGQPMFFRDAVPYYNNAYANATFENPDGTRGFNGVLDQAPHGGVHVWTGRGAPGPLSGGGWMQNIQTAGFDPIFWLHHSAIDRFWASWKKDAGGTDPNDTTPPTDPDWADASDDTMDGQPGPRWNFWANGNIDDVFVVHPGDMSDPANLTGPHFPHSYTYQDDPAFPAPVPPNTPPPVARVSTGGAPAFALAADSGGGGAAAPPEAREIASADEPVSVTESPATARVALPEEKAPGLGFAPDADTDRGQERVLLHLEGITSKGPVGTYEVYLNDPEIAETTEGEGERYVGLLSTFGADHAAGGHCNGLSMTYDITDLVAAQRAQGQWNESEVAVTFVPESVPEVEGLEPVLGTLEVEKVSIHTE